MSIREYLNNNPAVATVGVVVLLVVALGILMMQFVGDRSGPPPIVQVPYFDLGTGKVVSSGTDEWPPFDTGSGKQPDGSYNGVLMSVWTCDKCIPLIDMVGMTPQEIEDMPENSMFIAYIQKYNKKSRKIAIESEGMLIEGTDILAPPPTQLIDQGKMIKTLKGKKWVQALGYQGDLLITKKLAPDCPGKTYPKPCRD